jgi:archaemetzincin
MAVVVVAVGEMDARLQEPLCAGVSDALGCTAIAAGELATESFYDTERAQYRSTAMLPLLANMQHTPDDRVLGLTMVDLFIPVLTFVFGEAMLAGAAAVVSSHRLDPEVYGLPPDPPRLQQRLIKEGVHELGHTYGLVHCRHPACVMRASRAVDDVDGKTASFCLSCAERLALVGLRVAVV